MAETDWYYFQGDGVRRDRFSSPESPLPDAPPWRQFSDSEILPSPEELKKHWDRLREMAANNTRDVKRGQTFRLKFPQDGEKSEISEGAKEVLDAVNAAIYLRRPLLVTGVPGSGKTSLAYGIANELNLGPVLTWPITARSNLQDGLYRYDAIARLQDAEFRRNPPEPIPATSTPEIASDESTPLKSKDIGDYIQLRSVGTAFLPTDLPRVLLIDEIDKSDINLPNDLLNLFEEGEYEIPELVRRAEQSKKVTVKTQDQGIVAEIEEGRVRCHAFPIIVMTSNGERDFPPAFLRRCLRVQMPTPNPESLKIIIRAHFQGLEAYRETGANAANVPNVASDRQPKAEIDLDALVASFLTKENRATDQLLNTIHLLTQGIALDQIEELVQKQLDQAY